jgi:hypothetical protein
MAAQQCLPNNDTRANSRLTAEECIGTWRAFLDLSRHPCFEDDPEKFDDILHIFRSLKTLARPEDWQVIAMMRSYYLHKD